jgi:chromosome segregation ATPase
VTAERAVRLVAGAALAGQINAPDVRIDGLLFGSVVARMLVVGPAGRIWGDVHAVTVSVEPGGYVNGWLHSLTEDGFERTRAHALDGEDATDHGDRGLPEQLPAELRDAWAAQKPEAGHDLLLRSMLSELKLAHQAREELERSFDERVAEVAHGTHLRVRELDAALSDRKRELELVRHQQAERAAELALLEESAQRQSQELAGVRALLQQRAEALRQAEQTVAAGNAQITELQANNALLQEQLSGTLPPLELLRGRVESLESALQASVQRNAEQVEAQIRWQELAEASREKAAELETELERAQQKLGVARQLNDELKEKLEREQEARAELAQTALKDGNSTADVFVRNARLEAEVEVAQKDIAALEEQLAWARLSAETTAAKLLARVEEETAAQTTVREQLAEASALVQAYLEQAENWKANVGRLTELLYEAEQQIKRQAAELDSRLSQVASVRAQHEKLQQASSRQVAKLRAELESKERQLQELASRLERQRRP